MTKQTQPHTEGNSALRGLIFPFIVFIILGLLAYCAFALFGIGSSAFVYKDV